ASVMRWRGFFGSGSSLPRRFLMHSEAPRVVDALRAPDDALNHLLAGTQLVVERSPSGALMIRRRQEASTDATASTGSNVRVAQAGPAAADPPPAGDPPAADPQSDPPAPPDAPAPVSPALSEIVVTGSRIASRSYTSDSPLVGVSAAQIAATGQVSLDSALGQMPQFAAAQGQTET